MALMTAAIFRQFFPQLTGPAEDTTLDLFIARADSAIANWCGYPEPDGGAARTMGSATYTIFVDAPSMLQGRALCVCVHPIISITSVNVDATWVYGAVGLLTAGTDYIFDPREGVILLAPSSTLTGWPVSYRATKVVLVAGYATTPPDLLTAGALVVRHLWNLRNVQGQSAYGVGGDSATLTDVDVAIPAAAKELLQAFMTPCAQAKLQEAA